MHYIQRVEIVDGSGGLGKKEGGFRLWEELFAVLVKKEVAFLGVFQHNIHVSLFWNCVPEGDDVGMLHVGMQSDLSFH